MMGPRSPRFQSLQLEAHTSLYNLPVWEEKRSRLACVQMGSVISRRLSCHMGKYSAVPAGANQSIVRRPQRHSDI